MRTSTCEREPAEYGLTRNSTLPGNWSGFTFTRPDVTRIAIAGQRSRTAAASASPSIEPGICTSVNTSPMSERQFLYILP